MACIFAYKTKNPPPPIISDCASSLPVPLSLVPCHLLLVGVSAGASSFCSTETWTTTAMGNLDVGDAGIVDKEDNNRGSASIVRDKRWGRDGKSFDQRRRRPLLPLPSSPQLFFLLSSSMVLSSSLLALASLSALLRCCHCRCCGPSSQPYMPPVPLPLLSRKPLLLPLPRHRCICLRHCPQRSHHRGHCQKR
jgi:hypothetical protein